MQNCFPLDEKRYWADMSQLEITRTSTGERCEMLET